MKKLFAPFFLIMALSFCSKSTSQGQKEITSYKNYLGALENYNKSLKKLILKNSLDSEIKLIITSCYEQKEAALKKIKSLGSTISLNKESHEQIKSLKEKTVKALKTGIALREASLKIQGVPFFFESLILR